MSSVAKALDSAISSAVSRRATVVVSSILLVIVIVDMLSSRQTTMRFDENQETFYFAITVIFGWGAASWFLLGHASKATSALRRRSGLISAVYITVTLLQFGLAGFMTIVLVDRDYESITWGVNVIASCVATALLVMFGIRFIQWYRAFNNKVLLFYALAALSLAVTISTDYAAKQAFIQVIQEPSDPGAVPAETYPIKDTEQGRIVKKDIGAETTTTLLVPSPYVNAYHYMHQLPSTASFVFSWAATALALRYYNKETGRLTFWFLISVILALYIIGRAPDILKNLELIFPASEKPDWVGYIYRAGTIGGNVMFGVTFMIMGRKIDAIKDYLYIAAVGFAIIGFAHVSNALQPTFGIASHSIVMISSFLFTVGLYGSAVSISQDSKLRQLIRRSATDEYQLLDSIGKAQVAQNIEKKVVVLASSSHAMMADETGVSPSMTEQDFRQYLDSVLEEMSKRAGQPLSAAGKQDRS